jgi:hypothetical protein
VVKLVASIAVALMFGLSSAMPSRAAAGVGLRPTVVLVSASPQELPAAGGYATVRVQVRHAFRCTVQGQLVARGSFGRARTTLCASGHALVRLRVAANPYTSVAAIHFRATARSGVRTARGTIAIIQAAHVAAPPPAPALAIQTTGLPDASPGVAYNAALAATGGSPPYAWAITSGVLPEGLTLASAGVISGTPTMAGQSSFTAQVSDSAGQVVSTGLSLTVATATTVSTVMSTNWSGYVLSGGPFTGATGTFNVPTIYTSPTDTETSEWVGLDGASSTDPSIIQAGIDEHYVAATNTYVTYAWIELFPAPSVLVPVPVRPGDQVTVSIGLLSPGVWNVIVKDDSNGVAYSVNQAYAGPALSAEWIVEAPTSAATQTIHTVGAFSPVTFTQVGVNPVSGLLSRWVMVQDGVEVATPSDLSSNGFTVAYGSVTPVAP